MRRVCTSIAIVWILSAIISIPPLIGWNDWPDEFNEMTPCKLSEEKSYVVYSSMGSFYIPLLIMAVVYFKIFQATRRRLKDRAKASAMANIGNITDSTKAKTAAAKENVIVNTASKISFYEDSSSSTSPKTSQIKTRYLRCCFKHVEHRSMHGSGGGSGGIGDRHSNKKLRFSRKMLNETRIEIESVSDEHSRNEFSSEAFVTGTSHLQLQQNYDSLEIHEPESDQTKKELSMENNYCNEQNQMNSQHESNHSNQCSLKKSNRNNSLKALKNCTTANEDHCCIVSATFTTSVSCNNNNNGVLGKLSSSNHFKQPPSSISMVNKKSASTLMPMNVQQHYANHKMPLPSRQLDSPSIIDANGQPTDNRMVRGK